MANLYHILDKEPALNYEDIAIELNHLAQRLVKSGLLRIDANQQINFARFSLPQMGFNLMISRRELIDKKLLKRTRQIVGQALKRCYGKSDLEFRIDETIANLKAEIRKYIPIPFSMEMKLARIIVQSIPPIVIELAIVEKVQIFISYSHNIGDVLDMVSWQKLGGNSGMQSTDGREVAIYISCGGDPLYTEIKKNDDDKSLPPQDEITYGSGKPALARAMIIGGQELGHYSDIIRNKYGQQISRHSADFSGRKAAPHVKNARVDDLNNIESILAKLIKFKLLDLMETERHLRFYKKNRVKHLRVYVKKIVNFFQKKFLFNKIIKSNLLKLKKFKKNEFPASDIHAMLRDMAFNLAPVADVYKHPDKNIEEAIACIEALARIPQQVNKWGKDIVCFAAPNLYKIYYEEVIPRCFVDYKNLTGIDYFLNEGQYTYLSKFAKLNIRLKRKINKFFRRNKIKE